MTAFRRRMVLELWSTATTANTPTVSLTVTHGWADAASTTRVVSVTAPTP